jgi:hypothetical protein
MSKRWINDHAFDLIATFLFFVVQTWYRVLGYADLMMSFCAQIGIGNLTLGSYTRY